MNKATTRVSVAHPGAGERFHREHVAIRGTSRCELGSKLNLGGHAEECLALAERRGLVTLTADRQPHRRAAVNRGRDMLDDPERRGWRSRKRSIKS